MATYNTKVNNQGQIFVKKQSSVLSKALLVAGISFVVIFAFSYLLYFLLNKYLKNPNGDTIGALYFVSIICLITTIVMSMVVSYRINKVKLATIISMICVYGIGNGIMFGILFYAIAQTNNIGSNVNMQGILFCFLIAGGIFGISGLIGTFLSMKFTLTLGKFLMIATLVFMAIYLVIVLYILFSGNNFDTKTYLIVSGVWGLLLIGYIMYDFSIIKKSEAFMELLDSKTQTKFVFMFGFMLLVNLIAILWLIIRSYLVLSR